MITPEKILASATSAAFLALLWIAKPPETIGQKVLFFLSGARNPFLFRTILTVGIVLVNAAIWMG